MASVLTDEQRARRNKARRERYRAQRKGRKLKRRGAPKIERTPELARLICERLSRSNGGLETICAESDELPSAWWVFAWRREDDEFAQAITRAREIRDELHVDRAYVQLDHLVKDEGTVERTIIGEDGEIQTVSEPIDPRLLGVLARLARDRCDIAMRKAMLFSPHRTSAFVRP